MFAGDIVEPRHARRVPVALVGLGATIALVQVGTQILLTGAASLRMPATYLSFGTTGAFSLVVVYGGYWLARGPLSPDRYPRIAAWCLGLMAGFLGINLAMIVAWPADSLVQNVAWALFAASVGAGGGTAFGVIEARAIERARAAERARVHADHLETQREWLEYLNGLLRHEVLNTANVIVGYAQLLLDDFEGDEAVRQRLERIETQSRELTDVIQDVRLLIEASKEEGTFHPVDLTEVLREEAAALEYRYEGVIVETSMPDAVDVNADDLLGRVFSNLLENAVTHNDADRPRVELTVRSSAERVTVEIADDGPGVPADEQATLFEHEAEGDHGLGLYLVRTLVERYDGSVELVETGPDGSKFAVELPRVAAEADDLRVPSAALVNPARG